ncbi:MAG: tRNA (adenosine(37)-N6)-threonylcarbamoyltransferase complex transferase subunit TsaD [Clostridiales bacterium]|nr:tRNA (adenosine(37)-N6)-threonylcarbamoyltransferase complex transferase subunit TsaD [Clostridiales bacterium]
MRYNETARKKAESLPLKKQAYVLGIETSCDETAAAVVQGGCVVLSNVIYTQIPLHRQYGGVVPELASRNHADQIGIVVREALDAAGLRKEDLDAIAVTCRPGLVGALLVGVCYAKALALAGGLPLLGVDHIHGHIAANYISHPALEPPFVSLVASGGHSHVLRVDSYDSYSLLGQTRDDAAGEAYDKAARALGLPYPGGPELEKLARGGDPNKYPFHSTLNESDDPDMSFSGIKTALVNLIANARARGEELFLPDIAASFQQAINKTLTHKALLHCREGDTLCLAGGVCANGHLRELLTRECAKRRVRFFAPAAPYRTDNAAMIAAQGYFHLMAGDLAGLDLSAAATK